jgi:phosphatidylglycerol---prolipoprotein diacylglyceryl transferase
MAQDERQAHRLIMHPILFQVGGITIYAYGVFIAAAFAGGALLAALRARAEGIPFDVVVDVFFYSVLSGIIGARGLFVLIDFDRYWKHPVDILKMWEGGLVFFGGLVLAAVVCLVYLWRRRLSVWKVADLFSPSIALGLVFARVGCFLAGCCYGRPTALPWGVTFSDPDSLGPLHVCIHPTQLYEAAGGVLLFCYLLWLAGRKRFDGQIFWSLLLLYSAGRFLVEFVRDDERGVVLGGLLSTSQGIGAGLALLSLFMLFYLKGRKEGI